MLSADAGLPPQRSEMDGRKHPYEEHRFDPTSSGFAGSSLPGTNSSSGECPCHGRNGPKS